MAIIHDTVQVSAGSQMPSLCALIGTNTSIDVFDAVNRNGFGAVFGSDFDHLRRDFFETRIRPMEELNLEINRTVNLIMNPDRFRVLDSMDDFRSVPSCMEMAILTFDPVRQGVLQGRMEGFGYDPETLPPEDDFGRLIDNFTCEDVAGASDDNGYYDIAATLYSDDPLLSDDDLYAIRKTRDYIRRVILETTDRDPTAIDLPRG